MQQCNINNDTCVNLASPYMLSFFRMDEFVKSDVMSLAKINVIVECFCIVVLTADTYM